MQEYVTPPRMALKAGAISMSCDAFYVMMKPHFKPAPATEYYEDLTLLGMTQPRLLPSTSKSKQWHEEATAQRRRLICAAYLHTRLKGVESNLRSTGLPLHRALRLSKEQDRSERKHGVFGVLGLTNSGVEINYSPTTEQLFATALMEGLVEIAGENLDQTFMANIHHVLLHDDLMVNLGLDYKAEALLLVRILLLVVNDSYYLEMFALLGYIKSQRRERFVWGAFNVATALGASPLDAVDEQGTMLELDGPIQRLENIQSSRGRRIIAGSRYVPLAQCIELTDPIAAKWNALPDEKQLCLARFKPRTPWEFFRPSFDLYNALPAAMLDVGCVEPMLQHPEEGAVQQ